MRKKIIFISGIGMISSVILVVFISIILNSFGLMLTNLSTWIFIRIFAISAFSMMIQWMICIVERIQSGVLKFITSIISIIILIFSLIWGSFAYSVGYEPEHIVEVGDKKMLVAVNGFSNEANVYCYDYVNVFVKGNKPIFYEH